MTGKDSGARQPGPPAVGLIEVSRPRHGPAYYVFMVLGVLLLICSLFVNVVLFGLLAFKAAAGAKMREELLEGSREQANKIAIVSLEGPIFESSSLLPGYPFSRDIVGQVAEQLKQAGKDPGVKAIILEVDSPGGMVTTTDIIYQKLMKFKHEHPDKKLVVCMKSVATSGAYYVSMAGDLIVAAPTTVTGSIGVIMHLTNLKGLYQKLGLKAITIKSGKRKDIGSPTRPMSEEERQTLQKIVNSMQTRFVRVVRLGRGDKIKEETLPKVTDGSIFTAEQARELGLVDKIGYLDDAYDIAKELAGVPAAQLVRYQRPVTLPELLLRSRGQLSNVEQLGTYLQHLSQVLEPSFLYLWIPQTL